MRQLLNLIVLLLAVFPFVTAADFPIAMTFDKAITGDGYVVTMENKSDSSFRVKFSALGKTAEKVVDAGATWRLGHLEGFTFATGDKFSVTVADKTVEQVIPEVKILPLAVTFRKALLGSSKVLVAQRNKDSVKDIQIVAERPSNGEKKIFKNSTWGPTNTYEVGHLEGWSFQKGDKVTVTGEGFETIEKTVE